MSENMRRSLPIATFSPLLFWTLTLICNTLALACVWNGGRKPLWLGRAFGPAKRCTIPTRTITNSKSRMMGVAEGLTWRHRLSQKEAIDLDNALFSEYQYSVDQLMEIAGLSAAQAVACCYPVSSHGTVLVVCGPGNNGGDGLAAARHLHFFGYTPHLLYPKPTNKPIFEILVKQCEILGMPFLTTCPSAAQINHTYQVVMDAIFGFSFKGGTVREPFNTILNTLKEIQVPLASVDIPSGWDVDAGDIHEPGLSPDLLISLTAPKLCSKQFRGRYHYLGLRMIPAKLLHEYQLRIPHYPGTDQIVRIN